MQPMLKGPRAKRLKVFCDILLISFAFNFNLRRYTLGCRAWRGVRCRTR